MKKYSKEVLELLEISKRMKNIGVISRKGTKYYDIYLKLIKETDFLVRNTTIKGRLFHIENNLFNEISCEICKNPKKYNKTACSISISCSLNIINSVSGLTKAQEIAIKGKETRSKINPETGLTGYQEGALKSAKTMKDSINSKTGLTIYQENGLKGKNNITNQS